eukprot:738124-Pyramimonas_sp.AAC.1
MKSIFELVTGWAHVFIICIKRSVTRPRRRERGRLARGTRYTDIYATDRDAVLGMSTAARLGVDKMACVLGASVKHNKNLRPNNHLMSYHNALDAILIGVNLRITEPYVFLRKFLRLTDGSDMSMFFNNSVTGSSSTVYRAVLRNK